MSLKDAKIPFIVVYNRLRGKHPYIQDKWSNRIVGVAGLIELPILVIIAICGLIEEEKVL